MTFRYATLNDIDSVLKFIRLIPIREHRQKSVTVTKEELEKCLFLYHYAYVVLAEMKGEAVGYAFFYPVVDLHSFSTRMHIEDIFINAPLRRKGYGRKFMDYLANIARDSHWAGMEWNALDWNTEVFGFYNKIGAEKETGHIYFKLNVET